MMISRRIVQTVFGVIWFIDGLLQLKPEMFTNAFVHSVILPTAAGQPDWISALILWGAHSVNGHIAVWNTLFAVVQLALGLAFILNYKLKLAIAASLVWCAFVWVFGEGFGQLLTGQTLLLNGAPGAVLIYGLISIAILPKSGEPGQAWHPRAIRFAQIALAVLWMIGAVLHFQPTYLTSDGLTQVVAVPWIAKVIGNQGALVSVVMAVVELALALSLMLNVKVRIGTFASVVLSLMFWWAGQSFGQIFSPLSTDFNSGLLLAILAICACPTFLHGASRAATF